MKTQKLIAITLSVLSYAMSSNIAASGGHKAVVSRLGSPHRGLKYTPFSPKTQPALGEFVTVRWTKQDTIFGERSIKDTLGYIEKEENNKTYTVNIGGDTTVNVEIKDLSRIHENLYIGSQETFTGFKVEPKRIRAGNLLRVNDTVVVVTSINPNERILTVIDQFNSNGFSTTEYSFDYPYCFFRIVPNIKKQRRYAMGPQEILNIKLNAELD